MNAKDLMSSSLTPGYLSGANSPGSSIFDLPVQVGIPPGEGILTSPYASKPGLPGQLSSASKSQVSVDGNSFLVISGGTGCNSICSAFSDACYVLPVSDDGGSSSEIIRVLGGPSIGDIRSRLVRLIPSTPPDSPLGRIRHLLAYRLKAESTERQARDEWRDIVEGRSPLWTGIPSDRKELIRGFLVNFESELLRRAHKNFSFRNGSVGNYFLAAAQNFFRSLPSAIFLFSSITGSQANILPVLITNHTVTIAVELENGKSVVGQCNISHPVQIDNDAMPLPSSPDSGLDEAVRPHQNFIFEKTIEGGLVPLESRIKRLFYINAYGHEIHPTANPDFIANLSRRDVLLYSCGSLWTSIMPCLALKGVASAIARSSTLKAKVLLLNSHNDRETDGYTAVDYVDAITRTLNEHRQENTGTRTANQTFPVSAYITHLVHLKGTVVEIEKRKLMGMGIQCVEVRPVGVTESKHGKIKPGWEAPPLFDAECVRQALRIILDEQSNAT